MATVVTFAREEQIARAISDLQELIGPKVLEIIREVRDGYKEDNRSAQAITRSIVERGGLRKAITAKKLHFAHVLEFVEVGLFLRHAEGKNPPEWARGDWELYIEKSQLRSVLIYIRRMKRERQEPQPLTLEARKAWIHHAASFIKRGSQKVEVPTSVTLGGLSRYNFNTDEIDAETLEVLKKLSGKRR